MNIEQKMAYIRKALEMGAEVDVMFHNIRTKGEAKEAAKELSRFSGLSHRLKSHNDSYWYKLKTDDYSLETSIFFDDYMQEDVDLSGGVEDVG